MFRITGTTNIAAVIEEARRISAADLPKATATAISRTVSAVRLAEQDAIRQVFDRPTNWAIRGVYAKTAKVTDLTGKVWLKDKWSAQPTSVRSGATGTDAVKFLGPEVEGGGRNHKPFELALIRAGVMPPDMFAVPGERAPLDRFGNLSQSFIVRVLSVIGAAETKAGYSANQTTRSRKRSSKRADYFVGQPGNGRGPLGIWQRVGDGARPIIIFVKAPTYKRRFNFHAIADRITGEQFPSQFSKAFAERVARRSGNSGR